jgi:formylglycine-generating enzyme required for sulfatase activity
MTSRHPRERTQIENIVLRKIQKHYLYPMSDQNFTEILTDDVSFEMVYIKGGEFMMGDDEGEYDREKPAHKVSLDSFYIGKYLVTQRVWLEVMGENPAFFEGLDRPMEMVSWNEVQEFIQVLNNQTGKTYRLPTEAEWEYAARGGEKSQGFLYAGSDKLEEVGWYSKNSDSETKHVGLLLPNELSLYDMSGNVFEWCWDWFGNNYYEFCAKKGIVHNPEGPENGGYRVMRGGDSGGNAEDCLSTHRLNLEPGSRGYSLGFRLVFVPS